MGINKINSVVLSQEIKELLSSLASIVYVNNELNKKYNKSEVYNRQEIEDKFAKILGGTPPEMVDTIVELANALNNDPQFAKTIIAELSKKVDKVNGKQLSTENYSTEEKNKLANIQANAQVNPNAQEILSQLKTVDGSNSGLDADMLEGKEGDYYLNYKNFTNIPDVYTKNESNQLLNGKANANHGHDDKYYTETEIDNMLVDISLSADKIIKEKITEINDKLDETKMVAEHIEALGIVDLPNIEDGYLNIDKIEGNTLVNLLGSKGTATFRHTGTPQTIRQLKNLNLKANTTYSIIIKVTNFSGTTNLLVTDYTDYSNIKSIAKDAINKNGVYIFKYLSITDVKEIWIYFLKDTDGVCDTSDIMILEGDWTNKPIPSYFQDIKHVNSLSVKSVGKNLLPINANSQTINGIMFTINSDKSITINGTATNRTEFVISPSYTLQKGQYIFSTNVQTLQTGLNVRTDSTAKVNLASNITSSTLNITEPSAFNGARIVIISGSTISQTIKLQLEEGSVSTEYEEYKQDKIDILNELKGDKSLKRLPNGVADILGSDGVVDRKLKQTILTEVNEWIFNPNVVLTNTLSFYTRIKDKANGVENFLNSNFNVKNVNFFGDDFESSWGEIDKNVIYIRILKSKLAQYGYIAGNTATYLPAFKLYIKDNPITIIYELAEPVQEKLDIVTSLKCFKGGHLVIDSPIPVPLDIKYPTNFRSEVQSIGDALNNTIQNQKELDNKLSNIEVPVKSVNGKTGEVVLEASDIKTNSNKTVQGELDECRSTSNGLGQYINSAIGQLQNGMGDMSNRIQNIDENINNNYTRIQEGITLPTTNTKNLTFLKKL